MMADLSLVDSFTEELHSLLLTKPPVSKVKMAQITKSAMKGIKYYKHIVQNVERFVTKCSPEYKVPALYVIDSIVRQSRHQHGERDVYAPRFSRNFDQTFSDLLYNCLEEDRKKIVRVLNLWQKNLVFSPQIIEPLLDLADPDGIHGHIIPESAKSPTMPHQKQEELIQQLTSTIESVKNSASLKYSYKHRDMNCGTSSGMRFSKTMLGFDYDDEDDEGDETPTEAEPPLSTTLNKLEMEHRKKNDKSQTSQSSSQGYNLYEDQYTPHRQNVLDRWNKLMGLNPSVARPKANSRSRSRSPTTPPLPQQKLSNDDTSKILKSAPVQTDEQKKMERKKKGLPEPRPDHITICSTTLWLGHVPKTVSEANISDAFGEYGSITSIDLIPPRGCAYVCMDRRQDALKALQESRKLTLNGNHIKMAWAPGKGLKDKKFKDFWEVELGASFIPNTKIDPSVDLDTLEEGGVFDEDTLTQDMLNFREAKKSLANFPTQPQVVLPIITQPPPFAMPPPSMVLPQVALPQLPLRYGHLPLNSDPEPDCNNILIRPSPVNIPNQAIFQGPPFGIPHPLLQQNAIPPHFQSPPIFSQPPPTMALNSNLNTYNDMPQVNLNPELLDEYPRHSNPEEGFPIYPNQASSEVSELIDRSSPRPFGRLLPKPGQADLYPSDNMDRQDLQPFGQPSDLDDSGFINGHLSHHQASHGIMIESKDFDNSSMHLPVVGGNHIRRVRGGGFDRRNRNKNNKNFKRNNGGHPSNG